MIKDIVVNLPVDASRDVAINFSVSLAAKLAAHLTGIAFRYEPIVPAMVDMYGVPPGIIESQRVENEKTAKAAVAKFNEAARRAAISAEAHILDAAVAGAPDVFASLAR